MIDAMKAYYDRRAPEYDDWYLSAGLHADRERPGWERELARLERSVAALPRAKTLDVACGTGFLTRHLKGEISGLDQSERMLRIAAGHVPGGHFAVGDAFALPFEDSSFERVFTGHFYGHLHPGERETFLAEASRVADELVVVDSAWREGVEVEEVQERVLSDGSHHAVYKRYFRDGELEREIGGETLFRGEWFVMTRA